MPSGYLGVAARRRSNDKPALWRIDRRIDPFRTSAAPQAKRCSLLSHAGDIDWHANCKLPSGNPDAKGQGVLTNVMEIAMKRVQQGFTLIELMIVVAIVGILAAIALPAYQDYVIRSKMSEGVAAAAACKTSISEYVSTKNAWPTNADTAGCSTLKTTYVSGLTVTGYWRHCGDDAKHGF